MGDAVVGGGCGMTRGGQNVTSVGRGVEGEDIDTITITWWCVLRLITPKCVHSPYNMHMYIQS